MDLVRVVFLGVELKLTVQRAEKIRESSRAVPITNPHVLETSVASTFDWRAYQEKREDRKRNGSRELAVKVWIHYHYQEAYGPVLIPFYSPVDEKRLRIYCSRLVFRGWGLEYKYWCHNGQDTLPGPKLFSKLEYRELYREMLERGMAERVSGNKYRGVRLSELGTDFCFTVARAPTPLPSTIEASVERIRVRQASGIQIPNGYTRSDEQ